VAGGGPESPNRSCARVIPSWPPTLGRRDDELDDLHRRLLTLIQDPSWTGSIPAAVDVTLLGRFSERFGDHTGAVGRRVIFLVTGEQLAQLTFPIHLDQVRVRCRRRGRRPGAVVPPSSARRRAARRSGRRRVRRLIAGPRPAVTPPSSPAFIPRVARVDALDCDAGLVPLGTCRRSRCGRPPVRGRDRKFQSGQTTTAALPPSSRVTCLRGTAARICQPAGTDPVKETTGSRASCTKGWCPACPPVLRWRARRRVPVLVRTAWSVLRSSAAPCSAGSAGPR
jgi:hypothetical protein